CGDNREAFRDYENPVPWFGRAPEALFQGFAGMEGVEVHVLGCAKRAMQSPETLAPNVHYHSLVVPQVGWMRTGFAGCVGAIRRCLRAIQPDIVHGQGTERECAWSALWSGFPNVVTIHGNMAELARIYRAKPLSYNWLAARMENFTLPRTLGVLCNSAYTESLVKPRARKVWRLPNAIRLEYFQPSKVVRQSTAVGRKLLTIGVITPRKRQVELLELGQRLWEQGHRFEWHFVGTVTPSSYAEDFRRLLEGPAAPFARWHDFMPVEALILLIDRSDALVHFPFEEAFGLVVPEALARGLKFFGAAVGGIPDIAHGLPGVELFPVNEFSALEGALGNWMQREDRLDDAALRRAVEAYHPRRVAEGHVAIYREVLGR
ncbi:MAG: glycosyltransferase family 4 protein, partial [Verrucomicrobiia bacterium]